MLRIRPVTEDQEPVERVRLDSVERVRICDAEPGDTAIERVQITFVERIALRPVNDDQDPVERVQITFIDREPIRFKPKWIGPIEGYATNFINRNLWKVTPRFDFDDLYQDAYVFFLICCQRYPGVIDPPHFMALFKRCLANHFYDLAAGRTRENNVSANAILSKSGDELINLLQDDEGITDVEIRLLTENASGPLANLIETLVLEDRPAPKFERKGRIRETTEDYFRKIAKVDKDYPILERLQSFLTGEPTT